MVTNEKLIFCTGRVQSEDRPPRGPRRLHTWPYGYEKINMEWAELGAFVATCAAALALVIRQLEGSRCKKIKCCGCECDREVPEEVEEP